jgi:hypothetical protein
MEIYPRNGGIRRCCRSAMISVVQAMINNVIISDPLKSNTDHKMSSKYNPERTGQDLSRLMMNRSI